MKAAKLILYWIIGIAFVATGILKLINHDNISGILFDRAHYPLWFFYGVAVFELLGGILFIIRKTRQSRCFDDWSSDVGCCLDTFFSER